MTHVLEMNGGSLDGTGSDPTFSAAGGQLVMDRKSSTSPAVPFGKIR